MDQIAIQDWPGPPIDSSTDSNNSWMPAYGYQTPSALLEKEDFIGTSDAEYFLHGTAGQYMYLETIQEETSDDLRSESDAESRDSPLRWLATDSEDGSVICIDRVMDDAECESDREIACPPKRRKQDSFLSLSGNEDYDEGSISRSSSLLQFETLEKQCQQDSQSPSLFTHFSFESLNGIQETKEFCSEYDRDIFTHFGDEITRSKQSGSRDSLLYNASTRYSSSDSGESDITVENSRSCDNLKTWKSLDNLLLSGSNNGPKKFSSENLSEDSGYGDQLLISSLNNGGQGQIQLNVSGSATNLEESSKGEREGMDSKSSGEAESKEIRNEAAGFGAYDCEVYQNFNSNFGVSYQDLSIFDRYDPFNEPLSKSSPLTDVFLRKKHARQLLNANFSGQTHSTNGGIIIDPENSYSKSSKFSDGGVPHAASVPNLLPSTERSPVDIQDSVVNVSSVPKDLNFVGKLNNGSASASVAEKDWNLADLSLSANKSEHLGANNVSTRKEKVAKKLDSDKMAASYKREGSYDKAMSNRVDLSDDEDSLRYRKTLPKSPIVDFDRTVLKAISEQSLQSLLGSTASLLGSQKHLVQQDICQERSAFCTSTPTRKYENKSVAMSTPDLNWIDPVPTRDKVVYLDDDRRKSTQEISASKYDTGRLEEERRKSILLDCSNDEAEMDLQRKGSIIKSSTSTSGMSDIEDKTLRHSVKSFTGSNGSKGVHFSPVVAEVNWHDDASTSTVTPDRESIYSFNSSSPEPRSAPFRASNVVRPKPQYPPSRARRSVSQPDISDNESKIYKREFIDSLHKLRKEEDMSKSQPDVSKLKRRGSQLVKKDRDGCTVKAYTLDGVQYQHTHLDLKSLSHSSLIGSNPALNKPGGLGGGAEPVSKTNLTSKFPFYGPDEDGSPTDAKPATVKQSSTGAMAGRCNNAIGDDVPYSKRKNKSGLGGFLQRLASFRLGVKKGQERKEKLQTKKTQENIAGAPVQSANQKNPNFSNTNQKPNYIYIPLKAPSSTPENNNTNVVDGPGYAAKPPLPKQPPPRVVHASVKKTHALNGGVGSEYERRRRRTIDSVEIRDARHHHGNASMDGPMGLIETDLDTEVTVITNGANAKARSLLDLGPEPRLQVPQNANGTQNNSGRPHKSMEFLLDKQNLKVVEPPENELQKTERVMSEHELRIQRSLQKLTVPDWYKNSQIPAQGFLLKKSRETRWAGTGSKTTSLSSLGSGVQSPLVLSPTPSSQPFVRWSTSKLNSTASSPCQSTRSSFNQGRQPNGSISPSSARSSFNYRQPYLGWRSQERLNRPRTPAERLASTLLSNQGSRATQQENPEIQTSIKEVTSAIVHYVSGLRPAADDGLENGGRRSSSVSPRGSQKLCWLESSFVGTKPLDSPETPVTCSESPVPPHSLRLDLQNHSSNGESLRS